MLKISHLFIIFVSFHSTKVVWSDFFIKKVLLKLSSLMKVSQNFSAVKMVAIASHHLVCTAILGFLHIRWCGLLFYPL